MNECHCLTPKRRSYIENAMSFSSDFPEGEFMAYMEEEGIDVSELEVFSTTHMKETHGIAEGK